MRLQLLADIRGTIHIHVSLKSQAMGPRIYLEAEVQEDSQGCTD